MGAADGSDMMIDRAGGDMRYACKIKCVCEHLNKLS